MTLRLLNDIQIVQRYMWLYVCYMWNDKITKGSHLRTYMLLQ